MKENLSYVHAMVSRKLRMAQYYQNILSEADKYIIEAIRLNHNTNTRNKINTVILEFIILLEG